MAPSRRRVDGFAADPVRLDVRQYCAQNASPLHELPLPARKLIDANPKPHDKLLRVLHHFYNDRDRRLWGE
jgi:hypothetical protein